MNCPPGDYPTNRHNELQNFTAALLSELCHDVSIEPHLQALTGEQFSLASVNVEDGAHLDSFGEVTIKEMLRYLTPKLQRL